MRARYDEVEFSVEGKWSRVTVGMLFGRAGVGAVERIGLGVKEKFIFRASISNSGRKLLVACTSKEKIR